jgi:hypothetical protein
VFDAKCPYRNVWFYSRVCVCPGGSLSILLLLPFLIQIEHDGITYRWEDVCASAGGFPYEFPCARLTPLDLFQEARWFFDYNDNGNNDNDDTKSSRRDLYRRTWYNDLIQKKLVRPRIPRFGVLTELCPVQCEDLLKYRLTPTSAGFSPFALFADIGNLVRAVPKKLSCRFVLVTHPHRSGLTIVYT